MALSRKKKVLIIIPVTIILMICIAVGVFCGISYKCEDSEALNSTESVKVTEFDKYYFFDGPGTEVAFIFYPGGNVEEKSYSAQMKEIAQNGMDCFLVKMPLKLAFFGLNRADDIIGGFNYNDWYIGGHSLGGVMAASYANNNKSKLSGVILLAAWSTKDLSNSSLKVLTIYGSNDGVLNIDKVNKNASNLPNSSATFIIEGGNHSQFGCYGEQRRDNKANISGAEQRMITANKIIDFIR